MVRLGNVLTGPVNHCQKEWEPQLLHFNNNEKQINCKTCTLHMVTFPHLEKNATFGFQIFVHMFGRKIIFFQLCSQWDNSDLICKYLLHLLPDCPSRANMPWSLFCVPPQHNETIWWVCVHPLEVPRIVVNEGGSYFMRWPIYLITSLIWNV